MSLFDKVPAVTIKKDPADALAAVEAAYQKAFGYPPSRGTAYSTADLLKLRRVTRGPTRTEEAFVSGIVNFIAIQSLLTKGQESIAAIRLRKNPSEPYFIILSYLNSPKMTAFLSFFGIKLVPKEALSGPEAFEASVQGLGPKPLALLGAQDVETVKLLSGKRIVYPYLIDDGQTVSWELLDAFKYKLK